MDAISIVEAAYDCESDARTWSRRLVEHVGPRLDRGFGVTISRYAPGMCPEESLIDVHQMTRQLRDATNAMIMAYPDIFHRVLSLGGPHDTPTQAMGLTAKQVSEYPPYVEFLHSLGVRELVGVIARDPSGHAIFLTAPQPDTRRPTFREVTTWSRIAAHIGAAARLRRALSGRKDDWAEGADAVLSPSGSIAHAELAAQNPSARESLRQAVKAIDRARSKARSNEDEALDLWRGLVAGRWSLVEQFDSDGRRFLVARKNDPDVKDPRALTLRERQVLAYVAMGHPVKLIAYSLGVSPSSVSVSRRTAMRKLALRSPADVVRLFGTGPPSESPQDR
jgi:DNA-binding CsgD family transcriptional regulator